MTDDETEMPVSAAATIPPTPEKQDLHVSKLAGPDMAWQRMQPVQITPTKERLDAPKSLVTISNVSDREGDPNPKPQTHIVIDRFMNGIQLLPGETKRDVEMLDSDIEYFLRLRASNRFDNFGRTKPKIPILIHGYKPIEKRGSDVEKTALRNRAVA